MMIRRRHMDVDERAELDRLPVRLPSCGWTGRSSTNSSSWDGYGAAKGGLAAAGRCRRRVVVCRHCVVCLVERAENLGLVETTHGAVRRSHECCGNQILVDLGSAPETR